MRCGSFVGLACAGLLFGCQGQEPEAQSDAELQRHERSPSFQSIFGRALGELRSSAAPRTVLDLDYDVELYGLEMSISDALNTFQGRLHVVLRGTQPSTSQIILDVGRETTEDGVLYDPYVVTAVKSLFGRPLSFVEDSALGTLTVDLPRPLRRGELTIIQIDYQGSISPLVNDPLAGVGFLRNQNVHGQDILQTFGWPNGARRWLPSHDHPSDPARWIASVKIDTSATLISNGELLFRRIRPTPGRIENHAIFALAQPVPTYALQILAGDYTHLNLGTARGTPINAYVYPQDVASASAAWADMDQAFEHLVDRLGPYRFPHYTMVETPSAFGGMEHATIVSIADDLVSADPGEARATAIHELTHHWFGDNLHQSEWPAFWLNESLATFLTADTLGALDGEAAYRADLLDRKAIVFAVPFYFNDDALHFALGEVPGEASIASFFAPYYVGPLVWEMIRVQATDAAFWPWLKGYVQANQFSPWDTQRMLSALNAGPGAPYDTLFAEQIYTPGWAQVQEQLSYDAQAQLATLTVKQVQDEALFGTYTFEGAHSLRYTLDDGDESTPACAMELSFSGSSTQETASVACAFAPTEIKLSNEDELLLERLAPVQP